VSFPLRVVSWVVQKKGRTPGKVTVHTCEGEVLLLLGKRKWLGWGSPCLMKLAAGQEAHGKMGYCSSIEEGGWREDVERVGE